MDRSVPARGRWLLLVIRRQGRRRPGDEIDGWVRSVGALGAAFSSIAVLWQGLPNVIGH